MTRNTNTDIATLRTMTAVEYAVESNAATLAWIAEAPESRAAGILREDAAYWAERGCTTGYDVAHMFATGDLSDAYRQRYGIRPRFYNCEAMSLEDLWAEIASLAFTADELEEQRLEWEAEKAEWEAREAREEAEKALREAEAAEDALWASFDAWEAKASRKGAARHAAKGAALRAA